MAYKKKTVVAYLNGEVLCEDVLQAALDNNIMLADMKKRLIKENPEGKVEFKVK